MQNKVQCQESGGRTWTGLQECTRFHRRPRHREKQSSQKKKGNGIQKKNLSIGVKQNSKVKKRGTENIPYFLEPLLMSDWCQRSLRHKQYKTLLTRRCLNGQPSLKNVHYSANIYKYHEANFKRDPSVLRSRSRPAKAEVRKRERDRLNLVKLNLLKRKCQIRIERKAESRPHLNNAGKMLMAKTGELREWTTKSEKLWITAPISRNTMKQTSSAIQPFCEAEAGLSRLKSENGTISDEFGQAQPVEKKMSNKNWKKSGKQASP